MSSVSAYECPSTPKVSKDVKDEIKNTNNEQTSSKDITEKTTSESNVDPNLKRRHT